MQALKNWRSYKKPQHIKLAPPKTHKFHNFLINLIHSSQPQHLLQKDRLLEQIRSDQYLEDEKKIEFERLLELYARQTGPYAPNFPSLPEPQIQGGPETNGTSRNERRGSWGSRSRQGHLSN